MDVAPRSADELGSVVNALNVLQAFGPQLSQASISEMARATNLSRPTARRILLTLTSQGFAETDGRSFWLTPKVLRLGYGFMSSRPLSDLALPVLRQAGADMNESCSMAALDGLDILYLARVSLRRSVVPLGIGSRLPAHATSLGKVLVAFSSTDRQREYLSHAPFERLTEKTRVTAPELREQFERIRQDGYSINDGEREIGVRSAAVPILGESGALLAAINVSVNAARATVDEMRVRYVPRLQVAASQIADLARTLPGVSA